MTVELRRCLTSPTLSVMTFLNEVVHRFPEAISFAPGRPSEQWFDVTHRLGDIGRWVTHQAAKTAHSESEVMDSLGQYGDTAGLIRDLLAKHLALDHGIFVGPESIVVTTGCQEAMLIAMLALFDPAIDTLLVSDPTYIGVTGVAEMLGVPIHPIPTGERGLCPAQVEAAIAEVHASGRRPRALYDIPDFNNPLGSCIPLASRKELLRVVARHGTLILEDGAYSAFAYDHLPLPALKALDTTGSVIYLGSFAKSLFPGLRLGYMVADQAVVGATTPLSAALTAVKALTTVNTSPLAQALVGSALLEAGGSLAPLMTEKRTHYRANRDRMIAALEREFGSSERLESGVRWNHPGGGFFLTLTLPFDFGTTQLERCAQSFGVIVCPMSYFAIAAGRERQVRLSFSYVQGDDIDQGVRRFAEFVRDEAARLAIAEPVGARTSQRRAIDSERIEPPEAIESIVTDALARRGLSADDAVYVARALVQTSLRGVDTHGLRLLPTYLAELAGGRARARPQILWRSTSTVARTLDAGGALGIVAGRIATSEAIRLAGEHGLGAVAVRNSNHFGAASIYTLEMARAGFIGIACSNSDALVAPAGGLRAALGTNPLSVASAGDGNDMFCADLSTSQVAYSRVKEYRQNGWIVPAEWAHQSQGRDAGEIDQTVVLKPLGGYKGQCLGMIVEILSSVLSGGAGGHELEHFFTPPFDRPRGISHFLLAIDPGAFGAANAFRERLSSFLSFVRHEPSSPSASVLSPGDLEAAKAATRQLAGLRLEMPELLCIRELASEMGAPTLLH